MVCTFRVDVLVIAIVVGSTMPTASLAQALSGKINEDYGGVYVQSGPTSVVVGVLQGLLPERANLRNLRILLPQSDSPRKICFDAATFDGTYNATGELNAPPKASGALTIGDPNFSRHFDRVARYAGDELAVGLVVSSDCQLKPSPVIVPATYGGSLGNVYVAISTKPAKDLMATLTSGSNLTYEGVCIPVRSDKTAAFAQVCRFAIDPSRFSKGFAKLRISRKIGNAPRRGDPVTVYIAAAN